MESCRSNLFTISRLYFLLEQLLQLVEVPYAVSYLKTVLGNIILNKGEMPEQLGNYCPGNAINQS